ncbi:set domain-containing protein [Rutstroemia sp. NJR-2017a BBW]|nr:set domain-containing protein [Rutstroemia sp. NJR-2017a BBW]
MAPSQTAPKNWPANITYLTTPSHSPTLTPDHLSVLRTSSKESTPIPANIPRGASALVRITPITVPTHPANGQCGLFATKDLKPGTFILQYIGDLHAPNPKFKIDPHADSDYDLSLDRDSGVGIDAAKKGNEARFINDYRGVGEKPNAEFKEIWDVARGERGMGVWVLGEGKGKSAKGKWKGIKKGDEILVSYGRGFWGARKGDIEEQEVVDSEMVTTG